MNKLLQAYIQIKKQKSRKKAKGKDPEVLQTQRDTKTDRYGDESKQDLISAKKINPITTIKRSKPAINSNLVNTNKRTNLRSELKPEANKDTHSSASEEEDDEDYESESEEYEEAEEEDAESVQEDSNDSGHDEPERRQS